MCLYILNAFRCEKRNKAARFNIYIKCKEENHQYYIIRCVWLKKLKKQHKSTPRMQPKREKHENNNFQRKLNIRGVKNTNVAGRCNSCFIVVCSFFSTEKGVERFEEREKKTHGNVESELIGL